MKEDGFVTTRARVLASRLIEKIDNNESYARQIGLSYAVSTAGINSNKFVPKNEKKVNTGGKPHA